MTAYPTDKELKTLGTWDFSTKDNLYGLLSFLENNWHYSGSGAFDLKGKNVLRLRLSTFGWSGNEDRITALQRNIFWTCFWQKSVRGGHHYFKVDLKRFYSKGE